LKQIEKRGEENIGERRKMPAFIILLVAACIMIEWLSQEEIKRIKKKFIWILLSAPYRLVFVFPVQWISWGDLSQWLLACSLRREKQTTENRKKQRIV
jgi:hypothetical protein